MIAKTENSNYVRDLNNNAILACDKNLLLNHRKKMNESLEINKIKDEMQNLKTKMDLILTILKNKE
jgi:hypothetical protein